MTHTRSQRFAHSLLVLAAAWLPAILVSAESGETTQVEQIERVDREEIESCLKQLDELPDTDAEVKAKVRQVYQQALQNLDAAKSAEAAIAGYESRIASAAVDTEAKKETRDQLPDKALPVDEPLPDTRIDELEQKLSEAKRDRKQFEDEYKKLEGEPNRRTARIAEIPKLLQSAREQLAQIDKELVAQLSGDESAEVLRAQRRLSLSRQQLLTLTARSLEKERTCYEETDELIQVKRDVAAKNLAIAQAQTKRWQALVNKRREKEARDEVEEAKKEATPTQHGRSTDYSELPIDVQGRIEKLGTENAELAEKRAELAERITQATSALQSIRDQLKVVSIEFDRTQEMVEARGLSDESGQLLRENRGKLPNVRKHRRSIAQRQQEKRKAIFDHYSYNNRRSDLATLEPHIEEILGALSDELQIVAADVRKQLEVRRGYLEKLISDSSEYSSTLTDLNFAEEQLVHETEAYTKYIDGHVLWIRSAFVLSRAAILDPGLHALAWLGSYENWNRAGTEILQDAQQHPLVWAAFLALAAPMLYFQRRIRVRITCIGQSASRRGFSQFRPTFEALGLTLLAAIPWPGILWFVSWRLGGSLFASDFARATSLALAVTATVYLSLELLRQICRYNGLADVHFAWPWHALTMVRHHLRWLMTLGLPLLFVAMATEMQTSEPLWGTSLGRVAFIAFLLMFTFFFQRVLRPKGGVFQQVFAHNCGGWLYRLRYLWYPLIVASPLAFAVLATLGYYDTTQMLSGQLLESAWLVIGLGVLGALLNRWILMSRRKQAMEQGRQRWASAQQEATDSQDPAQIAQAREKEEAEIDLATVSEQTRRLIRAVLVLTGIIVGWLIWDDVVPALTVLKTVSLWPDTTALTLADLLVAGIGLFVTYVATTNVPGLLEFTVLGNLPLDKGARYAISTLSRYLIAILGLLLVGKTLGFTWSSIQWLIAAMGIGLGFGLQEIFANFVSGIILLFERPIRVGDIITLGETSGVVTRIHMRATTVTDWDRKEYVVPNKDLITGRLLNWTLSDKTNRIVVTVGVAYGSDTDRARRLLLKVAEDHPLILEDPAPLATFEGFGDSTLNLILRCYLPNLENRLATVSELHTAIDRAFSQAGIEIAFPQHDLHIRSIEPALRVLAQRGATVGVGGNGHSMSNGNGNGNGHAMTH